MINARVVLSHLIAMYHDIEYVKRNKWYDYIPKNFLDTSALERHNLIVVGMLLDIDVLPFIPEKFNPYDLISSLN
jgi:hypothetical protein